MNMTNLANILLLLSLLLPVAAGLGIYFLRLKGKTLDRATMAALSVTALLSLCLAFFGNPGEMMIRWTDTLSLQLRLDQVSRVYLALISVIWPGVGLYAAEYLGGDAHKARFYLFYTLTQGVLNALAVSGNLVTFYMFYEAMTLLTVPLVLHDMDRPAVAAAIKYLIYSVLGASAALIGIFFVSSLGAGGDFAAGPLTAEMLAGKEGLAMAIFLVMLIGFSVKAGMFPLHGWLPTAHPVAPAPASAVLSGVITKMGVLGMIRVIYFVAGAERLRGTWVQTLLLGLSLITVLMGSLMAFKEKKIKKRLAYSSVSQVSYVLFGLFTMTEAGFVGAVLHIIFHSLMKNTLFMGAGSMIHQTGKTEVGDYEGLGKQMPVTFACFAVASLGLIGIPPTGGFVSKWNLAAGALDTGLAGSWIGPAALLISAILTAAYLLTVVIRGCFGGKEGLPRCEVSWKMTAPMVVYSVLIVGLGLFSGGLIDFLRGLAAGLM